MYQSDRGNYRKGDSLIGMFWNSCLGRFILLALTAGIILIIAAVSCPTEEDMRAKMDDNFRQCLKLADSVYLDGIDNTIANIGYMFGQAETEEDTELMKKFRKHNRLEYNNHGIFATMTVINNFHYDGVRCGIGLFGMVIPTINPSELVLNTNAIRKEYNYKPQQYDNEDDFFKELEEQDSMLYDNEEYDEVF